ncbi:OmpP1/FadL family transporter [Pontibacter sp. 13R65]|uniref:OmpP1/FadL family transporter n=1 Tax=Pontibacter sp. 13R65 TaxID=3127458 RepID=UPI00301D805A
MYKILRLFICAAVVCLAQAVQAQNFSNSPYSRYGLGDINENHGTIRTNGMAGVGVSAGNNFQANTANPALLYYNTTTVFDIGIAGQLRTAKNSALSRTDGNANLSYLTLGVPLSKRWTSALSLRPYSTVNYQITQSSQLASNPQAMEYRYYTGEGGITEVNFAHGVRIADGLSIGASASYLFGTITKESASVIQDTSLVNISQEMVVYSERTRYSDLLFKAGASYRRKLTEKWSLGAGAVYSLNSDLNTTRINAYERRSLSGSTIEDNILADSAKGSSTVPASIRAGLSIDNGNNFTLAAEYTTQKWSDFRSFDGVRELSDSYTIALGAEYTPNPNAVSGYFKRVTYRAGARFGDSPYSVNGEQLKDMALTWGFTFPIGQASMYDYYQMNTAFSVGRRGTNANGLIQENYFDFSIGFTINSRWFLKRRLE